MRILNPYRAPRHPWLYRVWQVAMVLGHRPSAEDLAQVRAFLPPSLWPLFEKMPPAEQGHGIRVWRGLLERGVTDPDLLTAALLHDVGKARARLRLWERIWAVVAHALCPWLVERGCRGPAQGWRRALVVARHHAEWSARILEAHGASPRIVALVRHHHDRPERVADRALYESLILLQEVDQRR